MFQCTFSQVEAPSPRKTATRERKMFPTWPIASPISLPRAGWGTGWQLAHLNLLIAIPHIVPREGWGFSHMTNRKPHILATCKLGHGLTICSPESTDCDTPYSSTWRLGTCLFIWNNLSWLKWGRQWLKLLLHVYYGWLRPEDARNGPAGS